MTELGDFVRPEPNAAVRGFNQPGNAASDGRLAGPGFSDNAEHLTPVDGKVHTLGRVHGWLLAKQALAAIDFAQFLGPQENGRVGVARRGPWLQTRHRAD